jgi:hypothetical protein
MSLEMKTFVPIINDTMIPDWIARMNGLNMHCEIFPIVQGYFCKIGQMIFGLRIFVNFLYYYTSFQAI